MHLYAVSCSGEASSHTYSRFNIYFSNCSFLILHVLINVQNIYCCVFHLKICFSNGQRIPLLLGTQIHSALDRNVVLKTLSKIFPDLTN